MKASYMERRISVVVSVKAKREREKKKQITAEKLARHLTYVCLFWRCVALHNSLTFFFEHANLFP